MEKQFSIIGQFRVTGISKGERSYSTRLVGMNEAEGIFIVVQSPYVGDEIGAIVEIATRTVER